MSLVKPITVGDKTYNVAQAPAIKQKSLMLLVGAKIAFNSDAADVETIDTPLLVGALMTLPEKTFDEVSNIVLYKTMLEGETIGTDIGAFQGAMMDYFTLVAEAVAFNLNDFFTSLDVERAARRASNQSNTKN